MVSNAGYGWIDPREIAPPCAAHCRRLYSPRTAHWTRRCAIEETLQPLLTSSSLRADVITWIKCGADSPNEKRRGQIRSIGPDRTQPATAGDALCRATGRITFTATYQAAASSCYDRREAAISGKNLHHTPTEFVLLAALAITDKVLTLTIA